MNRLTPEQRFQIVQFYFENNGRARDFHKQILLSDEAHFWLNGYVNKQNCRIWSEANPQVYVEKLDCLGRFMGWWNHWSENWMSRLDYILASRGSHMPEIIFKMYCHKIIF
ncbi:hypothetical protein TNCV_4009341 [Trichonephila clavipes]|nr:hypothetical protein TNCV_4009341 [Trichonephila clavipes]